MENTDYPFHFEVQTPAPTKNIIKISGAYRRGNLTLDQRKDIEAAIQKAITLTNNGVFLIFDLRGLTYWDTLGINVVIEAIKTVNEKHSRRAGMLLKKDTVAFIAAQTRHSQEFASGRILCAETEDELISSRFN